MHVTSRTVVSGGSGNARKAGIEKQIKRLEKKKRELIKKLSGKGESAKQPEGVSRGTMAVSAPQTAASAQTPVAMPGASDQTTPAVPALPTPAPASTDFAGDVAQTLRDFQASSSSGSAFPEIEEDPEDIMKQIQLIEMQIMQLRQQLGDDAMTVMSMSSEDGQEQSADDLFSAFAGRTEEAAKPTVEVADGHVDGYA